MFDFEFRISGDEIDEIFSQYDKDGNSNLSFKEFLVPFFNGAFQTKKKNKKMYGSKNNLSSVAKMDSIIDEDDEAEEDLDS